MRAFLWLLLVLCHVTHLTETEAAPNQNGGGEPEEEVVSVDEKSSMSREVLQELQDTNQIDADVKRQDVGKERQDGDQLDGSYEVDPDSNPGSGTAQPIDIHGGVKMGEISHNCDDLKWNLERDWDNSTDYEYTCQVEKGEERMSVGPPDRSGMVVCLDKDDIPYPIHVCMHQDIVYTDEPPTAGPHRPNWPSFGTYLYCPAQRWIHTLEHGGVVMLYHPCADEEQVAILATIVRSCIRKHVITPYRYLPDDQPLALVTYGCKLLMGRVNQHEAMRFIKSTAMRTVESPVTKDGLYTLAQTRKADIVSDIEDSELCPSPPIYGHHLPIAESMDLPYTPLKVMESDLETKDGNSR